MSDKLYQLGKWAYKRRKLVLPIWIALLAVVVVLAVNFSKSTTSTFEIPGTEAQKTIDTLTTKFPAVSGAAGQIVFQAPAGKTIADYQPQITAALGDISREKDVSMVASPFQTHAISKDGRTAYAEVQMTINNADITEAMTSQLDATMQTARDSGLQVEASSQIIHAAAPELIGIGEIIGFGVAALVLVITFGSLIAAGMPLLVGVLSVGIGIAGIFSLGRLVDITSTTPVLALMLGLAVGIDYSLFIITKYRRYVQEGIGLHEAAGRAIATAGNAVVFAALTVIIALTALSVAGIPFLTIMGLAAAGTVAVAAAMALTLVPALLGFAGHNVLSRKTRRAMKEATQDGAPLLAPEDNVRSRWHWWGEKLVEHRVLALIVGVVAAGALAIPIVDFSTGFANDGNSSSTTTEYKAYNLIDKGFGPGYNGPLTVVVQFNGATTPAASHQTAAVIASNIDKVSGVDSATATAVSTSGDTAIIQVIPKSGPSDQATTDLVNRIRSYRSTLTANTNSTISVTGATAVSIDVDKKLNAAFPIYLITIVGLSLLVLIVVFRSILVPITATLGFLLTILGSFGVMVALFQWNWFGLFNPTPIVSFIPIILTGVLFGLAMDYEFFLVSGMHESYEETGNARKAVVEGFGHGAKVVTAGALIMVAVFTGFITSSQSIVQMLGTGLAAGVLIDAFIVRMTIIPAVMAILGKAAWWLPGWLEKVLPNVSIEGNEETYEEADKQKAEKKSAPKTQTPAHNRMM